MIATSAMRSIWKKWARWKRTPSGWGQCATTWWWCRRRRPGDRHLCAAAAIHFQRWPGHLPRRLPEELDCEPAYDVWRELAARAQVVPCARVQIQEAVDKVAPRRYLLRTPDGSPAAQSYVQHRSDGAQELFFIVNGDREHSQCYVLTLLDAADKALTVWEPLNGSRTNTPAQVLEGDLRYHFTLPPAGSLLLVASPAIDEELPAASPLPDLSAGTVQLLPDCWEFQRSEDNVLVLDRLCVSVDGGTNWWPTEQDFHARQRLAEHFGTAEALQWQPWVAIRKGLFDGKGGEVRLRYLFRSAVSPRRASLVMEDLHKGSVLVNGTPVDLANAGWHWDRGFGKVDITALVTPGLNTVEYRTHYDFLTEVEPAYIVGDFGVRLANAYEGELIAEPEYLCSGSWLELGYPFYSGAMTYRCQFNAELPKEARSFLRLHRASGILYRVRLNGETVGNILAAARARTHRSDERRHQYPGDRGGIQPAEYLRPVA